MIDTGIGIPEDQHEMIYHSFTQIDSSLTRKHSGNGLGLTITKRLVELMNGVMGMSSTVGKGSCFYFTLPMKTDSDDDYCLPAEKAEANDEKNYDDNETNQFDGISILLVEDNELNREVIVTILEDSGLNIDTATNGIEAVEADC
ncbi:Autoinducer 2 sensor kinase/phosphatase LuxQ [bioreactor metagenome]|uniref:histidine kinase n=1 Tax=bioreactor metagenome TaxID=1076179 RepID=A0A645IJC3_9ZZZZ